MLTILSSVTAAYLYQKINRIKFRNILVAIIVISLLNFGFKEIASVLLLGVLYQYNKTLATVGTIGITTSMLYLEILSTTETISMITGIITFILVSNDLNSSDHAIRKIGGMALTDPLTGAYNRNFYNNVLGELLSNSLTTKKPVSYMMLDIDHFKAYNDTHGHDQGDVILKSITQVFLKNTRSTDYVVRLGGEEFCIVLPDTSLEWAETIAHRIKKEVAALKLISQKEDNTSVHNTISIGISLFPYPADTGKKLEKQADLALYEAKEKRNSVVLYLEERREKF